MAKGESTGKWDDELKNPAKTDKIYDSNYKCTMDVSAGYKWYSYKWYSYKWCRFIK